MSLGVWPPEARRGLATWRECWTSPAPTSGSLDQVAVTIRDSIIFALQTGRKNSWIHAFPKEISTIWNANSFVQVRTRLVNSIFYADNLHMQKAALRFSSLSSFLSRAAGQPDGSQVGIKYKVSVSDNGLAKKDSKHASLDIDTSRMYWVAVLTVPSFFLFFFFVFRWRPIETCSDCAITVRYEAGHSNLSHLAIRICLMEQRRLIEQWTAIKYFLPPIVGLVTEEGKLNNNNYNNNMQ